MIILWQGWRVSNTNGNKKYPSAVRVYAPNGVLVGEVIISCRDPLAYLRERKRSKHLDSLFRQCSDAGMAAEIFNVLFTANMSEND